MHYKPHALLNCVAWFSLFCYGNAARLPPVEGLSHFIHAIGSALEPALANELQNSRLNRSTEGSTISRRQVDTRPINRPDLNNVGPIAPDGQLYPNQGIPFQYERTYQYRYPPYNQRIAQNFFPGGGAFNNRPLPNGLGIDPRFFQPQFGNRPLPPVQPEIPKPLNTNVNDNNKDNDKDTRNNNVNTIQNLDSNVDSKSSAQNRPFDGPDFPNQPGVNSQDPGFGNLRVDNRFQAIDYERVRQNYYSDPPINQQRNYYSSFNDIPLNDGSPYRSSIGGRYSGLDYNGDGPDRPGLTSSELRTGSGIDGIGDPYFNGFLQGPYRNFGYNSLAGIGGGDGGLPFTQNFGSQFNGPQYSSGFGSPFYSNGLVGPIRSGNLGYNNGDSSFRATASKESVAEAVTTRGVSQKSKEHKALLEEGNGKASSTRIVDKGRLDQA